MGNCRSKRQNSVDCNSYWQHQDNIDQSTSKDESNMGSHETNSPINVTHIVQQFGFKKTDETKNNNLQGTLEQNKVATVIDSTRAELNGLLVMIYNFQGTSSDDKNYRYLDEMLTRCILKLDQIECNTIEDRTERKEAIKGVNEAIAILERKLQICSDIKTLEMNLEADEP